MKSILQRPVFCLAMFYAGLLAYFACLDATLYFQLFQPIFLFKRQFLTEYLQYPGGLLEWLAQFVLQFLGFSLAATFITSTLVFTILLLGIFILIRIGCNKLAFIGGSIPALIIVALFATFRLPLIIPVRLLAALFFFALFLLVPQRLRPIYLIVHPALYFLLGGWMFLFYSLLCILAELLFTRGKIRFLNMACMLLAAVILPYLAARFIFPITLAEAYFYYAPYEFYQEPVLFKPSVLFYAAFAALPILLIFAKILQRLQHQPKKSKKATWHAHPALHSAIILIAAIALIFLSMDKSFRRVLIIDKFAGHEDWQNVLINAPTEQDDFNLISTLTVNRALCHTGKILEHLFDYNQMIGSDGLLISRFLVSYTAIYASDFYFDYAHVSAAQSMAYEAQSKFKYDPRVLKRLVLTNIINERYATAQKFVDLLQQSWLYKKWAQPYADYIKNPQLAAQDPFIAQMRALKPQQDFFINRDSATSDLRYLAEQNSANVNAFNYLLTTYLLDCKLGNIELFLPYFTKDKVEKIPRHIEEALLLCKMTSPNRAALDLTQFNINPVTFSRFQKFTQLLKQYRQNPKTAVYALKPEFGNTFWYYWAYGNPEVTKTKIKKSKIDENFF